MESVLNEADFVTLHVPELSCTQNLISKNELAMMKKESYLLNASRGSVVVLEDLYKALKNGDIRGAYLDVFPKEPKQKQDFMFHSELCNLPNVILTPHIGGATEEAQENIGLEVSGKLIEYLRRGDTVGAVNFPNLPGGKFGCHRIINVHKNVHGVLRKINNILGDFNILQQNLSTTNSIGYLIVDVDKEASAEVLCQIRSLKESIKTKILY
jgi:D-3-phosphoglycerate dehydrogenase